MLRLKNSSIKQRLTFIILLISVTSVVLTTAAISVIGVKEKKSNIENELELLATVVGASNRAYISFLQQEEAKQNLHVLTVRPALAQVCLYDEYGMEFAAYHHPKHQQKCPMEIRAQTIVTGSAIRVTQEIPGPVGGIAGYIYLESTLEEVNAYVERQTTIAMTVALAAFLIAYLLAVNLQRSISRPILNLTSVARHVTQYKDYSVRAPEADWTPDNHNEIELLTHSFNNMLTEIGERDRQLKEQNTELERAKDAAESSNRAKSQFLANISHELRTPLNAIIGFSSILMNQLFGPMGDNKYLEYARDINESGTHLLDTINDILDLSKAEAGKLALAMEEVHVGKAIQKCITIMTERAEKGQVLIRTNVPKSLEPLVVDRLRFIQIILNVLSNAVKFTNPGGIVDVSVATAGGAGAPSHYQIIIRDTGIGMTEADIHKALQSFGQVDSGLNRKYEGTGLGLPLAKKLIELHHGDIAIDSEVGKGTVVTLTFPVVALEDIDFGEDAVLN